MNASCPCVILSRIRRAGRDDATMTKLAVTVLSDASAARVALARK
jgi:hypothetical protein